MSPWGSPGAEIGEGPEFDSEARKFDREILRERTGSLSACREIPAVFLDSSGWPVHMAWRLLKGES